ncbi:MAG: recombination protein RecR [Candidatus Portnoybacteria bacterium CG_4_8_14_3_um_filter_44_10]|uniref:Recombination protein RecR n=4 Tax=Candidatus Portnoyibacteriota TaxID=1817913 RepID=A0A2H0WWA5_9BACT|nr:MAG: recombination protein RecR [Parcubacteria group bacterium CG2_30_44_18]PIS16954.1 MAG: recombination protein RecR [Candidatus Portnoybacteria bacterium CG09_land_8_20_14_0_10_44_13]PIW75229.1 MAG: recombination protein RecR [Candidatus Portnoybacteria bacterium CG_4_8_14_3_um_filter_44_10]PIZ69108.1 MAG: recombination protein RecR [Candidatus Portnoybacteria bacterium CG_4_10_14_0_2_um_filter_44_20]PJA62927.1 MAG: recombination protein RecR [Candidatus Portnoybacteria bacterium CG_4_9_1
MLPEPIKNLVDQLSKLPEIGPRAATRLAFFMLNQPDDYLKDFARAIEELKQKTKVCQNCFNLTTDTACVICSDTRRDQNTICVVEDILDIIPIERTKRYNGVYHILGGLIAPIEGLTPEKLRIKELENRIKNLQQKDKNKTVEIILAFNPTTEGDTTALYLQRVLSSLGIKITRLGRGLSTGSDLEYTDETTLINAFLGRR